MNKYGPIKRNIDEIDEKYNKRIWFIKKMNPKSKKDFENSVRLSNIWVNSLYLHCIYPLKTMNTIKNILLEKN